MAILYDPKAMLRRAMPKKTIEKLVTKKLTLNRTVLRTLVKAGVLGKRELETTALRVIRGYKKRYREEVSGGATKTDALVDATNSNRLMVQRVQNAVVFEVSQGIRKEYRGEYYIWLPSDASEPDPLHQLNYGKRFQIGKGEMPGDREGCRCGMQILVDETKLTLGE